MKLSCVAFVEIWRIDVISLWFDEKQAWMGNEIYHYNSKSSFRAVFKCVLVSLYEGVSVCKFVRMSVRPLPIRKKPLGRILLPGLFLIISETWTDGRSHSGTKTGCFETSNHSLSHELGGGWVSKRTNEANNARLVNEWRCEWRCKQMSKRTSGWRSTFVPICCYSEPP